eukprot:2304605-Rhodomonas_salina.2
MPFLEAKLTYMGAEFHVKGNVTVREDQPWTGAICLRYMSTVYGYVICLRYMSTHICAYARRMRCPVLIQRVRGTDEAYGPMQCVQD